MIGTKRAPASPSDTSTLRSPGWLGRRRQEWRTSPKTYAISLGFLLILMVGFVWVVVLPPSSPTPQDGASTASAPSAPTATVDLMPSPAVTCAPQPVVDLTPEQVVAAEYVTTWYPLGTMSAPSSAAAGPLQARRCFTRLPEGALYAAVTRMAEEAASTGVTQEAASKGVTNIRFDGYQWLSYAPDRAVLAVRISAANSVETRYAARVLDLIWVDNDWAVTPDDTTAAASAAADPKRIYTPWGEN